MADQSTNKTALTSTVARSAESSESEDAALSSTERHTFRQRLKNIVWDSLDYSPEERRFISKIDFFIL